eukprot:6176863-Amphidinium_carterae.1
MLAVVLALMEPQQQIFPDESNIYRKISANFPYRTLSHGGIFYLHELSNAMFVFSIVCCATIEKYSIFFDWSGVVFCKAINNKFASCVWKVPLSVPASTTLGGWRAGANPLWQV